MIDPACVQPGSQRRQYADPSADESNARTHARSLPMSAESRLALAWTNLRGLAQDHALLAVLELQRAGISLVKIVIAGIIISILAVSAWMGLVASAVAWAIGQGANWALAILVAALVNVVIAVALGFWAKKQVPDLLFAASLRQLRRDVPRKESEHAPDRSVP
jgi:uncharacterized membrane protein YqjE